MGFAEGAVEAWEKAVHPPHDETNRFTGDLATVGVGLDHAPVDSSQAGAPPLAEVPSEMVAVPEEPAVVEPEPVAVEPEAPVVEAEVPVEGQ